MFKSLPPVFLVPGLVFKSLIHFQLTFVYDVIIEWFSVSLFACGCPVSKTIYRKECPFHTVYSLTCHKLIDHIYVGLFLGSPLIYMSVFMPLPDCFDYLQLFYFSEGKV